MPVVMPRSIFRPIDLEIDEAGERGMTGTEYHRRRGQSLTVPIASTARQHDCVEQRFLGDFDLQQVWIDAVGRLALIQHVTHGIESEFPRGYVDGHGRFRQPKPGKR